MSNNTKWLKIYTDAEIKSVREAVDKVERTNANYRDSQNEWRNQMKDQTGTFVTRRELWGAVITIITMLLGVAALILKKG